MSLLTLKDISFQYPKGPCVFDQFSLNVQEGEMIGVLGPNGCGKSTLFDIITQHHKLTSGEILFRNQPLAKSTFQQEIGCVFQNISLDPYLTVHENLWLQGKLYQLPSVKLKNRIDQLSQQFQLQDVLDQRIKSLSGGYARRAEVAKALIHEPTFILLDEPSTGLDPKSRLDLFAWLKTIRDDANATILWITHLTDEVEKMDRVIMLHQGKIVCDGDPNILKQQKNCYHVQAVLKDEKALASINFPVSNLIQNGKEVHFSIAKEDLQLLLKEVPQHTQSFTYREPNLQDVYLAKTGEEIA